MTAFESSENGSFEAMVTTGGQDYSRVAASGGARVRRQGFYTVGEPVTVTVAPEADFAGCYVLRHEPGDFETGKKGVYTVYLYLDRAAGQVMCTINDDGEALIVDVPAGFTSEQLVRAILNVPRPMGGPPDTVMPKP
jgi:hypothetical protein